MNSSWDTLARARHEQLISNKDYTYSHLLEPKMLELLSYGQYHPQEIVDIGCGTGVLTIKLSEASKQVIGIDPSSESIKIAKHYASEHGKSNVSFIQTTVEEFADESSLKFDLAISHMALQTIERLPSALQGVSSLLRPKGRFLFCIPHPCFWPLIKSSISTGDYAYPVTSRHMIDFPVGSDPDAISQQVPYYHRPLETYFEGLSQAGFIILRIHEPMLKENQIKSHYSRPWQYPGFLFVLCQLEEYA